MLAPIDAPSSLPNGAQYNGIAVLTEVMSFLCMSEINDAEIPLGNDV